MKHAHQWKFYCATRGGAVEQCECGAIRYYSNLRKRWLYNLHIYKP